MTNISNLSRDLESIINDLDLYIAKIRQAKDSMKDYSNEFTDMIGALNNAMDGLNDADGTLDDITNQIDNEEEEETD